MTDILNARCRIAPFLRPTPLIYSPFLSRQTGGRVWLKLENQQPTGSFKVRGALNKIGLGTLNQIAQPDAEEKQRGIVTGSAGNHGLGVAWAAQQWGVAPATIFVPETAPRAKVDKMQQFGVSVHRVGRTYEDAHQAAEAFAQETGAIYIPAYDDHEVIAGQGTMALEICEQLAEMDMVIVPVGGGGMIAGVAVAIKAMRPAVRVIGVQPQASPAALLSLRDGRPYDPYPADETIADGLAGGFGAVPFATAHKLIDHILLASEQELRQAIFTLIDQHQLIIEASGAIAIAPLLAASLDLTGRTVVCILSGGNLDTALLGEILSHKGYQENLDRV